MRERNIGDADCTVHESSHEGSHDLHREGHTEFTQEHLDHHCPLCRKEKEKKQVDEDTTLTITISCKLYNAFTYAVLELMNRKGVVVLAPTPQILTTSELRFYPNTGNFEFISMTAKRYEVIAP